MYRTTVKNLCVHSFIILYILNCFSNCNSEKVSLYKSRVYGIMPTETKCEESSQKSYFSQYMYIYVNVDVKLRLFGDNLLNLNKIRFVRKKLEYLKPNFKDDCSKDKDSKEFNVLHETTYQNNTEETTGLVTVNFDDIQKDEGYFLCTLDNNNNSSWIYQGSSDWLIIRMTKDVPLLPLYLQILIILLLLMMSGLFSGLNLGLMSLDMTELEILERCGDENEKDCAKKIKPVRKRGNFLLCTILLGNVLVNNTLTVLMDNLTGSGYAAVIASTAGIVVFGEILPQAICSRYGLIVGAKTIWFTYAFMAITFIVSFPISKVLDKVLGEEIGNYYSRDRLKELLNLTQKQIGMNYDEMKIIEGALTLTRVTINDVMTPLEDVYMIEIDRKLDFETVTEINQSGYSRIPVYEKERTNIVYFLYYKDLTVLDTDKNLSIRQVCEFYNRVAQYAFDDTKLDDILNKFKTGETHMFVVQRTVSCDGKDPEYVPVGIVTLEDVIEEILQMEIVDETDRFTDNRAKEPRKRHVKDFSHFRQESRSNMPTISPQLAVATCQYLSTSIEPFKSDLISEGVLKSLVQKPDNYFQVKLNSLNEAKSILYQRGKPSDYFIIILQGKVEISIGKENMTFQGGSFHCFGIPSLKADTIDLNQSAVVGRATLQALSQKEPPYIPDYTVKATTDVEYLRVSREDYKTALQSTIIEKINVATNFKNEVPPVAKPFQPALKKGSSVDEIEVEITPLMASDSTKSKNKDGAQTKRI